jgi:hypothetical protein
MARPIEYLYGESCHTRVRRCCPRPPSGSFADRGFNPEKTGRCPFLFPAPESPHGHSSRGYSQGAMCTSAAIDGITTWAFWLRRLRRPNPGHPCRPSPRALSSRSGRPQRFRPFIIIIIPEIRDFSPQAMLASFATAFPTPRHRARVAGEQKRLRSESLLGFALKDWRPSPAQR